MSGQGDDDDEDHKGPRRPRVVPPNPHRRQPVTVSSSRPTQHSPATASGTATPSPVAEKAVTHRIIANASIQALVADDDVLIAGLQGGDIVAWSLDTYEQLGNVHAHEESVLGLCLSDDQTLLFSCGVDSVVNIWSTSTFERLYSLYSHYEVGDVFCLAYSADLKTLFCGAQNSSVQWYDLGEESAISSPTSATYPTNRKHRFFDSLGPGGASSTLPEQHRYNGLRSHHGGQTSYFLKSNYTPYAHKSYIYCMLLVQGLFDTALEEEVLITGGGDGAIKIWSIDDLSGRGLVQLEKLKNTGSSALSMAYSGLFLYVGLSNGVAHVYNLASHQLVHKLQVCSGDVSSIMILNGMTLCGTSTGWVKQFDTRFTEVGSWMANQGKILASSVVKAPHRDVFITAGNDNAVAFWDVTNNNEHEQEKTSHDNDELVNSLKEFVGFRTIAANPAYVGDCYEAVTFLRKLFNLFNSTTTLLPTDDEVNPILLAKFEASHQPQSRKTVLFYGHYDIVDAEYDEAGDIEKWIDDPFQLHPLNGYLYGRGVTDNKGPILAALYAVAELVQSRSLSCNVIFLLEGEEEAGSRGFQETVRLNRDKIGEVDYVLLSNSYWLDDHIPCLTYGMRGVVHATVTVASDKPDRHSGMDGKSQQHEPLKDMTVILSSLTGSSGTRIMIPGFYHAMEDRDEREIRQYDSITAALVPGHPEIKDQQAFTESLMQRWREPNLTVHRIEVPESKTAVTISRFARATLSIRIVPNQGAEHVATSLTNFLKNEFSKLQSTNKLEVNVTSKADAWLGRPSNQIFQALESAITEVWNPEPPPGPHRSLPRPTPASPMSKAQRRPPHRRASSLASKGSFTLENIPRKPLYIREGGSIPALSFLEKEFDAPAAMFPMGQASDNAHLCNERMRLDNLYKGREVFMRVFSEL